MQVMSVANDQSLTSLSSLAYVYFTWQTAPGSANWQKSYQLMGLSMGNRVAAINPPADGKMTLFVYGAGGLHVTHQTAAHSGNTFASDRI